MLIDITYLKSYHSEADQSLLGARISFDELTAPLLEIVLQHLNNTCRLLYISLCNFWVSREGCHAVFGLNKSCCSELDSKLNWIHLLIVESRLWESESKDDLVGLIQIPCESFSLLVLADSWLDKGVTSVSREELCEVAREVGVHPEQEYSLDSDILLLL